MNTSHDKPEKDSATSASTAPGGNQPQQQRVAMEIDDSKCVALYANFCRVMGTPEELIIDFGLNPQPFAVPTAPIPLTQRIVTNLYTAKRLLQALHLQIQRYEATFGVLETDVQKRVRQGNPTQP